LSLVWKEEVEQKQNIQDGTGVAKVVTTRTTVERTKPVILDRSKLRVDFKMDHRKKGLLWYATYAVDFQGDYGYVHEDDQEGDLVLTYRFPTTKALYSDFHFQVDGKEDPKIVPVDDNGTKVVQQRIPVVKGRSVPFAIAYRSQGLDWWRYSFGSDVNRVKN